MSFLSRIAGGVAVGTPVARCPPHRSGRAALPHPAPASGGNDMAQGGIWVTDASRRKMPVDVLDHLLPREMAPLATAAQHLPPQPTNGSAKRVYRRSVARHPVVVQMPPHNRPQVSSLLRDGRVHAAPQVNLHCLQLSLQAVKMELRQRPRQTLPARGPYGRLQADRDPRG